MRGGGGEPDCGDIVRAAPLGTAAARRLANVPHHSDSLPCQDGLGRARSTYVRRRPEDTVLHQVVREHLETFLAEARLRGGGEGVPHFVERELREGGEGLPRRKENGKRETGNRKPETNNGSRRFG